MTATENLIGARVRYMRRYRGMTQEALAQHMGFSHQVICEIEHGRRPVTLSEAVTMARLLGVTLNDLAYAVVA